MNEVRLSPMKRLMLCAVLALAGCAGSTPPAVTTTATASLDRATENLLRVGDELQIRLDTPSRDQRDRGPQNIPVVIDQDGAISLPLVGRVPAAGTTPGLLAERIEAYYVPRYYIRCSANVIVSARFFYVGGEVRGPGRYSWSEDTTVLKAINTAGGFTDYANRGKLEILRGDQKIPVNFEELRRNPGRDISLRPGDSVWVPRSIF